MNTEAIHFAIQLEAAIGLKVKKLKETEPDNAKHLLDMIELFEHRLETLLRTVNETPVFDPFELLGDETLWIQASSNLLTTSHDAATTLTMLWTLCELTEHSGQFYYQAAANAPHLSERLFFRSLSEVKKLLYRKLNNVLRTIYNDIWGTIGFAPFDLTRG